MSDLTREQETYESELPNLMQDEGKFVVIKGDKIHGVYDTYQDALKIAYEEFGVDGTFLVKKITPVDQVSFITRDILCPA